MLLERYGPLAPGFLRRQLARFEAQVEGALASFARGLPAGSRLLDAGAGELPHKDAFQHCRYVAVDLAVGDPDWDYSGLHALADLNSLPFADDSFDAAVNVVVLEHTREPARVVAELARVLKPSGRLLLVAPHQWEVHQSPHDYFRFTRHGLRLLLGDAGLVDLEIVPAGGYFTLLARRLMNSLNFFQQGVRWLFFPVVAFISVSCALILPLLDFLDSEKDFTLAYICRASKP